MKYDGPVLHERLQWIYAKLWELPGVGKEQKEHEALSEVSSQHLAFRMCLSNMEQGGLP